MHSLLRWTGAAAILLLAGLAVQAADEKPDAGALDRKDLDKRVYGALRDVINTGADLFNSGDQAGCYYLFRGALMSVRPLLDHHPELQTTIDFALAESSRMPAQGQAPGGCATRSTISGPRPIRIRHPPGDPRTRWLFPAARRELGCGRSRIHSGTGWAARKKSRRSLMTS